MLDSRQFFDKSKALFNRISHIYGYPYAVTITTSLGGLLSAIQIALFVIAIVDLSEFETGIQLLTIFLSGTLIVYMGGLYLHFTILQKKGIVPFSKTFQTVQNYIAGSSLAKPVESKEAYREIVCSLRNMPKASMIPAFIYPSLVLFLLVMYELHFGKAENAGVLFVAVLSSIFSYMLIVYIITEILINQLILEIQKNYQPDQPEKKFRLQIRYWALLLFVLISAGQLMYMTVFGVGKSANLAQILFVFLTFIIIYSLFSVYIFKLNIRQKLKSLVYVFTLIFLVLNVYIYINSYTIVSRSTMIGDTISKKNEYAGRIHEAIRAISDTFKEIDETGDISILDNLTTHYDVFQINYSRLQQLPPDQDSQDIEKLGTAFKAFFQTGRELSIAVANQDWQRSALFLKDFAEGKKAVLSLIEAIVQFNQKTLKNSIQKINYHAVNMRTMSLIITVLSIGFVLLVSVMIIISIIAPLDKILHGSKAIARRDFSVVLPVDGSDELTVVATAFNDMTSEIKEYTNHLELMVEERTIQLKDALDALWSEMELAKRIQTALLPEKPILPGYEISAMILPAREVAGDYYDLIHTVEKDWFIIGDVAGHGISAGLIMMMAQTTFQTLVHEHPDASPDKILTSMNRTLFRNLQLLHEQSFMTACVIVKDKNHRFLFSGQHLEIMIYRKERHRVEIIETQGIWLGIIESISEYLRIGEFYLDSGDLFLLYSDGIIEGMKKSGAPFRQEDLHECLLRLSSQSTEEIRKGILAEIDPKLHEDDVTLMVVKRTD